MIPCPSNFGTRLGQTWVKAPETSILIGHGVLDAVISFILPFFIAALCAKRRIHGRSIRRLENQMPMQIGFSSSR